MKERSDTESVPQKQVAIPCPMVQGKSAQDNKSAKEVCGWGPQCPICVQSASNLKTEDSKEEDWNGDRQKQRRKKSKRRKASQKEITIPLVYNMYCPMTSKTYQHTTTKQRKKEEKG